MVDVEFVKPDQWMVEAIAADMRQADSDEVWASDHHTPIEALMFGWQHSDHVAIVMCEGEPLVMIGLVKKDILTGSGIVWLLGSNAALKYKREFFTCTAPVIEEMLTICPRLCNMVHSKNKDSIRWLKWLGFTIEDPIPHGPEGEYFHRFHLERVH